MKIRTGFVSNSSSASFVICKSFFQTEEHVQKILDWYEKKSSETYMDDNGAWIENNKNYVSGGINYVQNDFWKLMKEMGIGKDEVLIMED